MIIEPYVEVHDVENIKQPDYGSAGKIALVGAFPTSSFDLDLFTDVDTAKNALLGEYKRPDDNTTTNATKEVVPDTYISYYCLDYIFNSTRDNRGAESVIIVNTNYNAQDLSTNITNESLAIAFQRISDEDFDILTIASNISLSVNSELNPVLYTIKSFVDSQYLNQQPFGVITGVTVNESDSIELLKEFKSLFNDKGIYKAVTTSVRIRGDAEALNIAQSGCWHSAYTAGRPVNKSETAKAYPNIIGDVTKDTYPLTEALNYKTLITNGFHTTKYKNRRDGIIQCINNVTPADYDMKVERVKNYIIKRLTLSNFLGDDNIIATRDYIVGLFESERQLAIQSKYLIGMEYNLKPLDSETIEAWVKLYVPDITRAIILKVALRVSTVTETGELM